MRTCEYCGSEDIEYMGADDGGGDYGDAVCDQWHCNACDQDFETDCFGDDDEDFDAEAYGNKDISEDLGELSSSIDDIPY